MTDWQVPISAASDEQIETALAQAHIPALMSALMHLTGNRDHFCEVRPHFVMFAEEEDGLSRPIATGPANWHLMSSKSTGTAAAWNRPGRLG